MRIVAFKSGHDASIAVIEGRRLTLSVEAEKDSFPRHFFLTPGAVTSLAEQVGPPDIVAVGGWHHRGPIGPRAIGAGYFGLDAPVGRDGSFFGHAVRYLASSHERSHLMMAVGLAPAIKTNQVVLVWEGDIGKFYLADSVGRVLDAFEVMKQPGAKYSSLYAISDPRFPGAGAYPRLEDAGKLMALAAFARGEATDVRVERAIDDLLEIPDCYPLRKEAFRGSPLYNCGVESQVFKEAAAFLSRRIFETFERAAVARLPEGLPLRISGGCGLNCDWNERWRRHGHFESVFVPPCTDDSGSAIGTAIDALCSVSGDPSVSWGVYSGIMFNSDVTPPPDRWRRRDLRFSDLADCILSGQIVACAEGRCELGPRALGNRSLLADPFSEKTSGLLNYVKGREPYRPVACSCRMEDAATCFATSFEDPHMLYFRRVTLPTLRGVTHVDGSCRVQTVRAEQPGSLRPLLDAMASKTGVGVVANTSLNFRGHGFINRASDLITYCEATKIKHMLIEGSWFERIG